MWTNTDAWVNWFDTQAFATPTEYFLYLIDESSDFPQTEQWAQWIDTNPGPGSRLKSMATIELPTAETETPSLDIPTSWVNVGIESDWDDAFAFFANQADKRVYLYNSNRPASGSFARKNASTTMSGS